MIGVEAQGLEVVGRGRGLGAGEIVEVPQVHQGVHMLGSGRQKPLVFLPGFGEPASLFVLQGLKKQVVTSLRRQGDRPVFPNRRNR